MHQPTDEMSENSRELNPILAQLNFPGKLHLILKTPELNDIICWQPHGRSWRVLQQKRFEKEVLPVFFRHGNYSSFIRQVNGWGFRRIQFGQDINSYYHESFLRDDNGSHRRMKRPTTKENADRKSQNPDTPPNFYLMPPVLSSRTDTIPVQAPSLKQDLYTEHLSQKLSHCSIQGKMLVLQMEMNQLIVQRARVLAALQAVAPKSILGSTSPSPYDAWRSPL